MVSTDLNVISINSFFIDDAVYHRQRGFSLIELALVLLIVGILTAGGLRVFSTSHDQQDYQQVDHSLSQIQDALIGHYLQFGRLPCPDSDQLPSDSGYGYEKPRIPTGTCTSNQGWLPHVILGISGEGDVWGNRYRYMVHPLLTSLATNPLQVCGVSSRQNAVDNIIIHSAENPSKTLAEWVGFAIVSTGKNGKQTNAGINSSLGAFSSSGGCTQLSSQEQENCDNDLILNAGQVLSDRQMITFDDRVVWVSDLLLIATARKAGLCF